MPRIFPTVVRRVTTIISGGVTNYLARVNSGTRLSFVGRLVEKIDSGTRLTFAPSTLKMVQRMGTRLTFAPAVLKVLQRSGTRLSFVGTLVEKVDSGSKMSIAPARLLMSQRSASRSVEAFIIGSSKSFVVTMTNDTANTRSWTSPANAQGANNGTKANWDGSLAIAQVGTMHGTTIPQPNRPATLLIDSVWVAIWGDWSGLPVADDVLSGLSFGYRIGGITALDVQLARRSVSSGSDAGTEFRIDDGAGKFTDGATPALSTAVTWPNIALLQLWAKGQTLLGIAAQYNIDAMRLRVEYHETVPL